MNLQPASPRRTKPPTLKEVAQLAGVSISTTSRALGGHPAITEATAAKVRAAATELSYQPNAQARALRASRTATIGLTIPSVINPYFAALAAAVQHAASEAKLSTILFNSNEDPAELATALRVLASHRVDGLLVVPHEENTAQLMELQRIGLPIVLVDRDLPDTGIPSVTSDPTVGLTAAVNHLKECGHLPIGYLSGPMSTSTGRQRWETFHAACQAAGLEKQPVYHGGYHQSEGYEGTRRLWEQGVRAIIAGDSMMSIGALEACHDLGVLVGRDIALVGFDDHPVFRLQAAPLTIIDQHVSEIGARAFGVLQQLIAGGTPPTSLRLPTELKIRASTECPAGPAAEPPESTAVPEPARTLDNSVPHLHTTPAEDERTL
ncbi:LacI family DNA-binding transcriptional regulator [Corynebacterium sp. A21]|uniref:LacI family DNA-binding transcriptional regulator n=1 Tax=Corynebacterium sp. A21 TaxID=3457318 RepID=UPI003FD3F3D2